MKVFRRSLVALALMAAPALAQTQTKTVEPSPTPLSAEKQAMVRDHVRRAKIPEAKPDAPLAIGGTVPDDIDLWALPQDSVTEVPTTTTFRFFLAGKTIAVVDPESRRIVQLISN